MIKKRLTAAEFIEKIATSPAWSISRNNLYGEIQLTVLLDDGNIEVFLGPDPLYGSVMDTMRFLFLVDELTTPTSSNIDLSLPALKTDEFFAMMGSAVQWTTEFHEPENRVQLTVLTPLAKIERYISKDVHEMSEVEFDTFMSMLEIANREK